jgi:hypothetical protein
MCDLMTWSYWKQVDIYHSINALPVTRAPAAQKACFGLGNIQHPVLIGLDGAECYPARSRPPEFWGQSS